MLQNNPELKSKIDQLWNKFWSGGIHQNHIFRVRINDHAEINSYYLSALVGSSYGKAFFLKSAKQTTGIASINSTQLKKFPAVLPTVDLQNQFAAIVEKVESLKSHYQHSLTELGNLYGVLSQKAFKGKLDLSRIPLPPKNDQLERDEPTEKQPHSKLPLECCHSLVSNGSFENAHSLHI